MTLFLASIVFIYKTPLRNDLDQKHYLSTFVSLIVLIISCFLYKIAGKNPGDLQLDEAKIDLEVEQF